MFYEMIPLVKLGLLVLLKDRAVGQVFFALQAKLYLEIL